MSSEIRLRILGVELGNTIFTGRPGPNDERGVLFGNGYGPNGTYATNEEMGYYPDEYRAGVIYVKIGPFKFGPNNETIRDRTQNWLHDHWVPTPRFKKLDRPNKWLWQFGW